MEVSGLTEKANGVLESYKGSILRAIEGKVNKLDAKDFARSGD